jgi:hypothetical protein
LKPLKTAQDWRALAHNWRAVLTALDLAHHRLPSTTRDVARESKCETEKDAQRPDDNDASDGAGDGERERQKKPSPVSLDLLVDLRQGN